MSPAAEKKTISGLLIEDDPDDTLLLMKLLSQSDWASFQFAFHCAATLKAGLAALAKNEIEIVLLDLMLPDSQGVETITKIHAAAPDIPVVVMTGLNDEAMGLEALRHGAQDFQVKGNMDGHVLKRTISYAVERHRLQANVKTMIENAPDAMVLIDSKGIVQFANAATDSILRANGQSLTGKSFPHPLPASGPGEIQLPAENDTKRTLEVRVSEIEWQGRRSRLASIRDITDLRRIEQLKAEVQESRRMDKLKDSLMSAVSHEMRSPLTIIKATASNLREGLAGPLSDKQSEMVEMQCNNIRRLEKIVDNILDLSRLESGKATINLQAVDAAKLVRDVITSIRLIAKNQLINIQQEVESNLPMMLADPEMLTEVLMNLLDNAVRFTESKIVVRAESSILAGREAASPEQERSDGPRVLTARKFVRISVIDDGVGIPQESIGGLFNKFVQVTRKSRGNGDYKGTGLGLAICKEIIERHGGKIWVESSPGQGAHFHFTLPRYEERNRKETSYSRLNQQD